MDSIPVWMDYPFKTQLINNNFDISIDDISLENDAWCIKTLIDNTFIIFIIFYNLLVPWIHPSELLSIEKIPQQIWLSHPKTVNYPTPASLHGIYPPCKQNYSVLLIK